MMLLRHNNSCLWVRKGSSFIVRSVMFLKLALYLAAPQTPLCILWFQASILKAHMITHSSRKDYECKLCGTSFRTKGSLIRHHRRHTGEERTWSAVCSDSVIKQLSKVGLRRAQGKTLGVKWYLNS